MLLCERCGHVFEESESIHVHQDYSVWDIVDACPNCRSLEVAEARICNYCGEWADADELEDHMGLCERCANETLKRLNTLILENFHQSQLAWIREFCAPEVLE